MNRAETRKEREEYLIEIYHSEFKDKDLSAVLDEEDDDETRNKLGRLMREFYSLILTNNIGALKTKDLVSDIIIIRNEGQTDLQAKFLLEDFQTFCRLLREREEKLLKEQNIVTKYLRCLRKDKEASVLAASPKHWGSRQQLRCGKIIGDALGGIDAVFGALLHPTGPALIAVFITEVHGNPAKMFIKKGGIITEDDISEYPPCIHSWLYRQDYATAVKLHVAARDACGYLRKYHGVGPGHNYLSTKWTLFPTAFPQSCHWAGISFWIKVINGPNVPMEY